ncbi:MAG: NTP transferase domain-containing protein [Pseudomonadales bacterium]
MKQPIPVAVLAGERPGGSALARHFQQPSSVLVALAGATPLEWAVRALQQSEAVHRGWLLGPEQQVLQDHPSAKAAIASLGLQWRAPKSGPAQTLLSLCQSVTTRPMLVTTADHALLTAEIVDHFVSAADEHSADLVIGLVPYALVASRWPASVRTQVRLRDGVFCGANLFMLRNAQADNAIALWRSFEARRKKPWRLAQKLGYSTLLRYLLGQLSLAALGSRFSELSDCQVRFVQLPFARAAVDVDSVADWHLAESELSSGASLP